MNQNDGTNSISGRVSAIQKNNNQIQVTIDSTAFGQIPPSGENGSLHNFFYEPGGISDEQMVILQQALYSKIGVTVNFQMGGSTGRTVNSISINTAVITINQNMFFCDQNRWSPKGVCYQPQDGVDPLSDNNFSDIQNLVDPQTPYGFTNLGINCLRVYQVDPTAKHDKVMQLLAASGIYVLVGAVNAATAITGTASSVPTTTVTRVKEVADAFAAYDNVLGFSISNELLDSNDQTNYGLVSIVKQVKQQMQAHMQKQNYRAIPIGCCTRDDPAFTFSATQAYTCGPADLRMDFIGYNAYRWVVDSGSTPSAGTINQYYLLYQQFQNFPVPVMLTEMGAQCTGGRNWTQIPYIFGETQVSSTPPNSLSATMSDAISGCFAFRFYEQGDGFGLVNNTTPPSIMTSGNGGGYQDLQAAYNKITSFTGTPNGVTEVKCSSLTGNPYAGNNASGGLPSAVTVTLTNSITSPANGTTITFNYTLVKAPTPTDWISAATIPPLGSAQSVTFPAGTMAISMVYETPGSQWLQGCQLQGASLLALQSGDTIQGQWESPNGNGICPIVTA
ncbi:MAG: 1 3-beta-glucanosyltransferase [Comamonadaceae bacterium]|nr:MAG: 1 3-beta-glucanosyltransferase [Comamonadaceae bacterium]